MKTAPQLLAKLSFLRAGMLAAALIVSQAIGAATEEPAFIGLDAAETAALKLGEAVVRSLRSSRELAGTGTEERRIAAEIKALGPNYLTEVISLIPSDGEEDALARLAAALADVEGYVGIPYYSEQFKTTYDLFGSMRIVSRSKTDGGATRIDVVQGMKPFGEYAARYELLSSPEHLLFRGENTSPIKYRSMSAVKERQMLWLIAAYPADSQWVFYGVGAVRAFDLFGAFRGRMETSFEGRTESFLNAMQSRMRR